jgi:hypothetical protein
MVQRKELAICDTIIGLYERKTGIYRSNEKLMEENFRIKNEIAGNCPNDLKTCNEQQAIYKGRANRRGWTIAVLAPVALGAGYLVGSIIN